MEAYLPMAGIELLFGMIAAPLVGLLAYWMDSEGGSDGSEGDWKEEGQTTETR